MSEELARTLRRMKDESGRSLRELERATHVSDSALSRYLAGQATPPWSAIVALCRATGRDPRALRPIWERARAARREPEAAGGGRSGTPRVRNDLPRDVAGFTARGAELARLLDLARNLNTVALDGMAGVGKTALAVHAGHLLAADFPDCRIYLDLHGYTPGREPLETDQALRILLRALEIPAARIPDDRQERASLWRSELAGRRALIVLDNALDAEQLQPLLPGAGAHAVIAVSRRRLVDLDGSEPLSLEPLGPGAAAELFAATLGDARAVADPEAIGALMQRCGRLPLAIRLAAGRLRHRTAWSVADLVERAQAPDPGVVRILEPSWRRLDPEAAFVLRTIARPTAGEFEPCAVAELTGMCTTRAEHVLERLLDANLVQEAGPHRYRVHDLVRAAVRAPSAHPFGGPGLVGGGQIGDRRRSSDL